MIFSSLLKPLALSYAETVLKKELERFGVERVHGLQTSADGGFVVAIDLESGPKDLVIYGVLEFGGDRVTASRLRCNVHWVNQLLKGSELSTTRSVTIPAKTEDIQKIKSLFS